MDYSWINNPRKGQRPTCFKGAADRELSWGSMSSKHDEPQLDKRHGEVSPSVIGRLPRLDQGFILDDMFCSAFWTHTLSRAIIWGAAVSHNARGVHISHMDGANADLLMYFQICFRYVFDTIITS